MKNLDKILIIQTAFIGDVILATALVEKLKSHYPGSTLHFLLRKGNENLLLNNPKIDEIIVFEKRKNKYGNLIKVIRKVRGEKYDLVINVQRYFTTGLITVLSGAKQTRGFNKNPLSMFFSKRFKHAMDPKKGVHEIERNQLLVADLTEESPAKPALYPTPLQFSKAGKYNHNKYVCIAPASVWFTKQWPVQKWIAFINRIPNSLVVYLIGSKEDKPLCDHIKSIVTNHNVRSIAGELDLLESAALMKNAVMNFVNDSAPMHLGSAVNAPTTVVFCSTVPGFGFGPLADKAEIVEIDEPLACRPCGLHGHKKCPRGHFNCAEKISEVKLEETLLKYLNNS